MVVEDVVRLDRLISAVADVSQVVNCGPAHVHGHAPRFYTFETLFFSRLGVVQMKGHVSYYPQHRKPRRRLCSPRHHADRWSG